jgi:hypothetical protein
MEKIILREAQAPYTLMIDKKTLQDETIIVEQNGQPVAVLVPMAEYQAFRAWRQRQNQDDQPSPQQAAFEQERTAFQHLLPELLHSHPGKVVAIYQGQVVEVGEEIGDTLDKVYDRFGYIPCYVQRVQTAPRIYKFPHRKVMR